jgi:hypothetical protein
MLSFSGEMRQPINNRAQADLPHAIVYDLVSWKCSVRNGMRNETRFSFRNPQSAIRVPP